MIQTQRQSVFLPIKHTRLERLLQTLIEHHHQRNAEEMRRIVLQFDDKTWRKEDLATIYKYIVSQPSNFYDAMKWGFANKLDECKCTTLDLIFILSCIFIDNQEFYQSDEELSGVQNLNDTSFSFGSLTNSQEKSITEIDYKAKINQLIVRMDHSRLAELIRFLIFNDKLSELQALEIFHEGRRMGPRMVLALGEVFVQTKQFKQAVHMFMNYKEESITMSCFIDIMIANCSHRQSQQNQIDLLDPHSTLDHSVYPDLLSSVHNCTAFGVKYFRQRNYIKAYHYFHLVWRMYKHPNICHHLAKTLQHLGEYDEAFKILSQANFSSAFRIQKAIYLNLIADLQTLRGNIEAGYNKIQQSYKQFREGYQQNKQTIDYLNHEEGAIFVQPRQSVDIYKNYYSLAFNEYKALEKLDPVQNKQQFQTKTQNAIRVLEDFIIKVDIKYPQPYIYLTNLYIGIANYIKAGQYFKVALQIFKKQQMKVKTHEKLLFLQMAVFQLNHLLDQQSLRQAEQLIDVANSFIPTLIKEYMEYGRQFFQRGEYTTAKIAFKQVLKIKHNRNIPELHHFMLGCYQMLSQYQEGYKYFEKQVQQIYLSPKIFPILQRYCSSGISQSKLKNLFLKVKLNVKNKRIYLKFIEMMIDNSEIQLAKSRLEVLEALYSQQQSSQDYCQLGILFSLIQNLPKALKYFKKGLERDHNQQKNQFYLSKILSLLNQLAKQPNSSQQIQNFIENFEMADVNDSINLLHIGNIFLQKGRIRDSYEYLKRAFESNPQENTYQSLIKVCGQLNLKQQSIIFIRRYIKRLKVQLSFYREQKTKKINILKELSKQIKRISLLDASWTYIVEEGDNMTLKEYYFIWLRDLVSLIFSKDRINSDEFVADLITFYLDHDNFQQALKCITTLIQKYPRYISFVKMKDYCSRTHNKPALCLECQLRLSFNDNLLGQLFLITQVDNQDHAIRLFIPFYGKLKEKSNDKKNNLLITDMCSLLTSSEAKKKSAAFLMALFRVMILFLKDKKLAEKVYRKQVQIPESKGNLGEQQQFKASIEIFLNRIQKLSQQSQEFLVSFCFEFASCDEKAYILERQADLYYRLIVIR